MCDKYELLFSIALSDKRRKGSSAIYHLPMSSLVEPPRWVPLSHAPTPPSLAGVEKAPYIVRMCVYKPSRYAVSHAHAVEER